MIAGWSADAQAYELRSPLNNYSKTVMSEDVDFQVEIPISWPKCTVLFMVVLGFAAGRAAPVVSGQSRPYGGRYGTDHPSLRLRPSIEEICPDMEWSTYRF